jgi:antirestriction protein ArdC
MEKVIKDKDLIGTPYEGFQIKRLVEESTTKTTKSTIEKFQKSMDEKLQLNIITGLPYVNSNQSILSSSSDTQNYVSCIWGTFLQYNGLGYRVRKGEKSTTISRFVLIITKDKNGKEKKITPPKYFKLFNMEQVEKYEEELKKVS